MLASIDWGGVAGLGALGLTILVGTARLLILVGRLSQKLEDQTTKLSEVDSNVKEANRHLASVMGTEWQSIWRISAVEDFLENELHYHPPRVIPLGDRDRDDPTR